MYDCSEYDCWFIEDSSRQIITRLEEGKSISETHFINKDSNQIAAYLADHGAHTWTSMKFSKAPSGRIREFQVNFLGKTWMSSKMMVPSNMKGTILLKWKKMFFEV